MRKSLILGHFLGACLLMASSAWGQGGTNSGTISGEVDDSSGAKISGAKVEITSPALIERVRDTATGDDGLYKIVNVPPGVYVVTASQAGFSTAKRENIEITVGFTATVNFSMTPGSVEQTVTVSSEAPVLDTQDTNVESVLSNNVITSLPLGKSASDYPSLIPGAVAGAVNQDVGGLSGENNQGFRIHGSASGDYAQLRDGMYWNTLQGAGNLMSSNNPTATQEIQIETSGYSAEDWNSGGHVNIIPKNGGNDLHGSFQGDYAPSSLLGNNVTPAIQNLAIGSAASIKQLYEAAGGVGGPIKKDKLWFYVDARHWVSSEYQAGNLYFYDAQEAAPFPNNLYYAADPTRRGYSFSYYTDVGLRLTWQATKRNQFTENFIEEKNCNCEYSIINGTMAPEALSNHAYQPNWREQATWTFPANNKLVLWAGLSAVVGTINDTPTGNLPTSVPVQDLTTPFTYGANDNSAGNPSANGIADFLDINENFTASYVTGAHAFKMGFTMMEGRGSDYKRFAPSNDGYPLGVQLQMSCRTITTTTTPAAPYPTALLDAAGLPTTSYKVSGNAAIFAAPSIASTTLNTLTCPVTATSTQALLPSQLIQYLAPLAYKVTVTNPMGFAQDQWRIKRLTLNLGLRFDWYIAGNQKESTPANPQFGLPAINFAANTEQSMKDLNPRIGAAYDVFGNGKTAIKASLARSVFFEALGSSINNPVLQLITSATRSFNDTAGTFVPVGSFTTGAANGELGAASGGGVNSGFYLQQNSANITYANDITNGWMNRPDDWMLTATVQQEIVKDFALSFDYYRTWFGNLTVAQNTAIPAADYNPYCVTPPVNTFYNVGGTALCNLYDPNPALFTGGVLPASTWVVKKASDFSCSNSNNAPGCGNESDVFTGIDVLAKWRFRGLTLQGGVTAGHEVTSYCVEVNSPEDLYWTLNAGPGASIIQFANNNFGTANDAAPCYINPPWYQALQFKALVVYTVPRLGIKLSANEQNLPSIPLAASYNYSNSTGTFMFANGRTSLSGVNTSTYKVEALTPQTVFPYGRNNQLDFRVGKLFTIHERWKIEPTADFFNLLNANTILSIQTTFNTSVPAAGSSVLPTGAWRSATQILPARLIKFGVHIDF